MKTFIKYALFLIGFTLAFWAYRSSAIISAPSGTVSVSQQDIATLKTTLAKDLNTINDRVVTIGKNNDDLKNSISDLRNALSKANEDIRRAQDTIANLQKKLDENNRVISTYVEKTSKDFQAQVDKMSSFAEKRFDTINTTLNDFKGNFAKIAAQMDVLKAQYAAFIKPVY